MRSLFILQISILLLLFSISSNAQYTLIEHYNLDSCKYKVDSLSKNHIIGISFFDCKGNPILIHYGKVDSLPQNTLNNFEWNLMLKNEISKLTQMDLNIFLIYGIIVNKKGRICSIEKLGNNSYDLLIETKIVHLISESEWKPAIKDGVQVEYYFSLPIKINLM